MSSGALSFQALCDLEEVIQTAKADVIKESLIACENDIAQLAALIATKTELLEAKRQERQKLQEELDTLHKNKPVIDLLSSPSKSSESSPKTPATAKKLPRPTSRIDLTRPFATPTKLIPNTPLSKRKCTAKMNEDDKRYFQWVKDRSTLLKRALTFEEAFKAHANMLLGAPQSSVWIQRRKCRTWFDKFDSRYKTWSYIDSSCLASPFSKLLKHEEKESQES